MEKWSNIRSMRESRSGVKVVAMGGLLYVVGGWDGHQRLRSGEVLNPDTQMWSDLPNMSSHYWTRPRCPQSLLFVFGNGQEVALSPPYLFMTLLLPCGGT